MKFQKPKVGEELCYSLPGATSEIEDRFRAFTD
jgi:hypothetical protein